MVTARGTSSVTLDSWSAQTATGNSAGTDALTARGYFLAFQAVQESPREISVGGNPGDVLERDHQRWYRALFDPAARAGLYEAHHLAGYRVIPIYITNARHVSPSVTALRDGMSALWDLLRQERHPAVRAVLGHVFFVYPHPYVDGTGRLGRIVMNTLLVSGGYPWTVIPLTRRAAYMQALEQASSYSNIGPFTELLATCLAEDSGRQHQEDG